MNKRIWRLFRAAASETQVLILRGKTAFGRFFQRPFQNNVLVLKSAQCFFVFCFFSLAVSCDILRHSPYEVEAWTPGEGFHGDPGKIKVSLLLSHASDKAKTEQAFSMTEDRKILRGNFSWKGSRLFFNPASPLELDRDYRITLGTGAQDTKGISLERKFEASFSTRFPGEKPRITRTEPEHGGILFESRGKFRLYFSEPVRLDSCHDFISFEPSTPGSWNLEDENKSACFIPREPWQAGSVYRVKVDSGFKGRSGSILGTDYLSDFYIGEDREKPVLLKVLAVNSGGGEEEIPLEKSGGSPGSGYTAWERFSKLCLVFSEPVDLSGIKNILSADPALPLVMESPPEMSRRAVFRFEEYPAWGSSFLFRLACGVKDAAENESVEEYAFRITAAGPLSKPPALVGIRLPLAPGDSANREAVSFSPADLFMDLPITSGKDRYPFAEPAPSWVELYFETAPDTEVDPFSVMDLFRVEFTNQALVFSPRSIRTENFTWADPREGWENFSRLEIQGFLTNTVQTGIVTFRIPPGLKDKRGNRSTVDFRVSLLK